MLLNSSHEIVTSPGAVPMDGAVRIAIRELFRTRGVMHPTHVLSPDRTEAIFLIYPDDAGGVDLADPGLPDTNVSLDLSSLADQISSLLPDRKVAVIPSDGWEAVPQQPV